MAEGVPYVQPTESLEILIGNRAPSWQKWKQKLKFTLPTVASNKSDEIKVGLLLNHIGDHFKAAINLQKRIENTYTILPALSLASKHIFLMFRMVLSVSVFIQSKHS